MALRPPVSLIGRITVSSGVNDAAYWNESGSGDLITTVTPGTYEIATLAQEIANAMTTESGVSGATNTYSGSIDITTGKITINRVGGSADWYPRISTSQTANILTGGVVDSDGDTLSNGQYGLNHCGWILAASNPSAAQSHTSDQAAAHTFIGTYPPSQDSEEVFEPTVVEAVSVEQSGDVYRFNGWKCLTSEFPLYGGLWQSRTINFQRESQANTTWYLSQFWGPFAGSGGIFRYYPDNTDSATYYQCRLTEEALRRGSRGVRQVGYAYWTIEIPMRRASV